MTALKVDCPRCGATLRSRTTPTTGNVRCPRCEHRFSLADTLTNLPGDPPGKDLNQPTVALGRTAASSSAASLSGKARLDPTVKVAPEEEEVPPPSKPRPKAQRPGSDQVTAAYP